MDECYIVLLKRQDGSCPKFCKAAKDCFFDTVEEAISLRNQMNFVYSTQEEPFFGYGVFKLLVEVQGKEIWDEERDN